MAFDEALAARIRKLLRGKAGVVEKKMFGGLAFLLNGNMCVGVHGSELVARLDPAATDGALSKDHTRPFDLTGRPMKGWILVAPQGMATDETLGSWIGLAAEYAGALPRK